MEYVQVQLSKYKLFEHLALQLPPFWTPFCIGHASHYCYPTANLEILIQLNFSAFVWHFQPQRPIVADPLRWKQWLLG